MAEVHEMKCPHRHTVYDATGYMSFSGGDIIDTIKVRVLCLDCLQYVDGEEEDECAIQMTISQCGQKCT